VPHPSEHRSAEEPLSAAEFEELAETLRAFASPSRLKIVAALLGGGRTVDELAGLADLTPSATSHQLRLLRAARVVRASREGRHIRYSLHDHHVAELIAAVRHHHEHVHPPVADELKPDAPGKVRS
jgi:DNA-binding transcriptional ArsR family regulator